MYDAGRSKRISAGPNIWYITQYPILEAAEPALASQKNKCRPQAMLDTQTLYACTAYCEMLGNPALSRRTCPRWMASLGTVWRADARRRRHNRQDITRRTYTGTRRMTGQNSHQSRRKPADIPAEGTASAESPLQCAYGPLGPCDFARPTPRAVAILRSIAVDTDLRARLLSVHSLHWSLPTEEYGKPLPASEMRDLPRESPGLCTQEETWSTWPAPHAL